MSTPKSKATTKAEPVSKGTLIAAKYRARANKLSDDARANHRHHAMSLIYGNTNGRTVHARSH